MNRWYDKHKKLGHDIDLMETMSESQRTRTLQGILEIIQEFNPTLLDDFVLDFPMDIYQKRWYDKDPYLWITLNGLSFGNKKLWDSVAALIELELEKAEKTTPLD
jgi:hypothetical protein